MARILLGTTMILVAGCSGKPGRVKPPDVDAAAAAASAVEQFDQNGDKSLATDELAACASLAYALPRYDTDRNNALSQNEIEAGIARWKEAGMGARSISFRVKLGDRALEGAQVKLIPEPFLDEAVLPAIGEAGRGGNGFLGMPLENRPRNAPNLPLVQPGLYRVEITHPTQQIPAKYNSNTTLGLEVARDSIAPEGVLWSLATGK
jgi:hypothetical protein